MQVFGSSHCNYHDFKLLSFVAKKKKKFLDVVLNTGSHLIKSSLEWVGKKIKIESEQQGHTPMINSI